MAQIKEYGDFKDYGNAEWEGKTTTNAPLDTRRSEFILSLQLNTVENLRQDWLLMATSPRNQQNLCTQELFPSEDSDWLFYLLNSTNSSYGEEILSMLTLRHSPKRSYTSLLDLCLETSKDISSLSTKHYMEQGLEVHVGMTNSLTPSNTWGFSHQR